MTAPITLYLHPLIAHAEARTRATLPGQFWERVAEAAEVAEAQRLSNPANWTDAEYQEVVEFAEARIAERGVL